MSFLYVAAIESAAFAIDSFDCYDIFVCKSCVFCWNQTNAMGETSLSSFLSISMEGFSTVR